MRGVGTATLQDLERQIDALEREEVVEVTVEPRLRAFQFGHAVMSGKNNVAARIWFQDLWGSFHMWLTQETYRFL